MTALEVSTIEKRIEGVSVLEDVSVNVREGSIHGVVGPNGAGKTTTFRCALGLLPVDAGSVSLFGSDPREDREALADVGVVFEYETLHPTWSVRESMAHACHVYGVPTERIETCLSTVGLEPEAHDRAFEDLSKGMKRKASVATALLHEPDLLVLDEPLSGLDPGTQRRMRDLIDRIQSAGRTVVFSSHDLEDVQRLCDRVTLIDDGRTVVETSLSHDDDRERATVPAGDVSAVTVESEPATATLDTEGPGAEIDVEELYFSIVEGNDER